MFVDLLGGPLRFSFILIVLSALQHTAFGFIEY
jgi:hypothetical protein